MAKNTGTVIQIVGPVLDIRFADGCLPELLSAIEIPLNGGTIVAEVAQHIGDNVARCIAARKLSIPALPSACPSAKNAWAASLICWASPSS